MTITERLEACEVEIARLREQIAALQTSGAPTAPARPPKPMLPKLEDEGMTIRIEAPGARFAMPSEPELRALHRAVLEAAPFLHSEPHRFDSADAPFQRFCDAFRALGGIGRQDKIDDGKALSWWIDQAKQVLTAQGASGDIDAQAFVAAILAHGDVPYRPLERFPYELGFGLIVHGGRPAKHGWRGVLRSGRISAPIAIAKSQNYAPPRTTIG